MRLIPIFALLLACPSTGPDEGKSEDDVPVDSDGDGLLDDDEGTYGTDPGAADSDGDGWNDGAEIDAGANPTLSYSHPFEQGDYLVGDCPVPPDTENAGPTGTGSYQTSEWTAYQQGDVLDDFNNVDSYGQEITPYAFCGNYTLITESAMWCGPCQALASEMSADMAEIRETYPNFIFYELLIEDARYNLPETNDLESWRDEFELAGIPVVGPKRTGAQYEMYLNHTGGIPSTTLLAPDMTVIWSGVDNPSAGYLASARQIMDAIAAYEASNE